MNATDGLQDGTLISSSDGTAPVVFDGMYPGAATVSKTVGNLAIRADAGEVWRFVNLTFKGTSINRFIFTGANVGNSLSYKLATTNTTNAVDALLKKVTDVNIGFSVTADAAPADSGSPDTSVQMVSWGWRVS
jgi:hypothetical protein